MRNGSVDGTSRVELSDTTARSAETKTTGKYEPLARPRSQNVQTMPLKSLSRVVDLLKDIQLKNHLLLGE